MPTQSNGQIHVYTGHGKCKTTTALGMAIRALGADLKVGLIYFDKGGDYYNERKILDHLLKTYTNLQYQAFGTARMTENKGFRFENIPEDFTEAKKALALANQWIKQDFDLLILDEINTTIKTELLKTDEIINLLKNKPEKLELILTGRYCPQEIIDLADLATEMAEIKHYANNGVGVRPGIDY